MARPSLPKHLQPPTTTQPRHPSVTPVRHTLATSWGTNGREPIHHGGEHQSVLLSPQILETLLYHGGIIIHRIWLPTWRKNRERSRHLPRRSKTFVYILDFCYVLYSTLERYSQLLWLCREILILRAIALRKSTWSEAGNKPRRDPEDN